MHTTLPFNFVKTCTVTFTCNCEQLQFCWLQSYVIHSVQGVWLLRSANSCLGYIMTLVLAVLIRPTRHVLLFVCCSMHLSKTDFCSLAVFIKCTGLPS